MKSSFSLLQIFMILLRGMISFFLYMLKDIMSFLLMGFDFFWL